MKGFAKRALSRLLRAASVRLVSERDFQLLETVKRDLLASNHEPPEDYVPQRMIGAAGYSLNDDSQLALLRSFRQKDVQALFRSIRNNEAINIGFAGKEFKSRGLIHNGYYPSPDAEIYAAMISLAKPERIVEIGSGFSTLIARNTIDQLHLNCTLHVVDPQPRTYIEKAADSVEYLPVERSSLVDTKFSGNTLLFIDSSHVCRSGGDAPFLYCNILPELPEGILVHIHDIFLPFDYPNNYADRFYTEGYLLHALLANSSKFEVVFATHYMTRKHRIEMRDAFGPEIGTNPLHFGSSFWIRSAKSGGLSDPIGATRGFR